MATVGDIVVVIDATNVFPQFIGRYGIVTEEYGDGQKVMVKFEERVDGVGSLSHTAFPSELKVVGRVLEEEVKPKEKIRLYFNSGGTVRTFPVSSLQEAGYLMNQLADADLRVEPDVGYNIIDLEMYDEEEKDWVTYYDDDGLDFSDIYDRDYRGEMTEVNVRFLVRP